MALGFAHPATRDWFSRSFHGPTTAQEKAWPAITGGASTLLLAPTGSGKTLAAFLVAIDRLMFGRGERPEGGVPKAERGVRVLYISPLKALGVDVERNLRAPLAGIRTTAEKSGAAYWEPTVGVRSGDTPQKERAQLARNPPDVLITTPESLYLLLTSKAREGLATVDVVIIDEIHSMVGTKRGAHLALSLERLEALRRGANESAAPLQRIGLSATQRPLAEVARFLGGSEGGKPRPVEIVDAGRTKEFRLSVEVPVEDMTDMRVQGEQASDPESPGDDGTPSIWPKMHVRLLELIRAHRSTMLFVNSRRLAERLATALNDLAGEEIVLAHHGSIAKDTRAYIEDRLKRGTLPAIAATSSLELGIDMGAVDLVIQVEAPPSVASGVQRIGRAGHHVGAVSEGVFFPKYRGDLLACAAVVEHVRAGRVEETYYPRNPLDVLAQQIVAMVVDDPIEVDTLWDLVRGAAPFSELPRRSFEGVLDMLSGRYPSDRFSELKPRVVWDRIAGRVEARRGAKLLSVVNGGTIPDRGLYGVYLSGAEKPTRVGELDEEMVFESQPGDVFLLGATSWRIDEVTHDRVLVTPAPGELGRMPFWHGDRPGRPIEFGRHIGALARTLSEDVNTSTDAAKQRLMDAHGLDDRAADNLVRYIVDQREATDAVPSDRTIVVERFVDAVGDWCVAVLSPFGGRVHAPWATAVAGRLKGDYGVTVDSMWADDGMMFRLPDTEEPPDPALFVPPKDEIEQLVVQQLADTSLFAARFRENAGRALLLPKRRPGQRVPLWLQRRRSADLLQVASDYADFPIVLETYRECLRDVFDVPGLEGLLGEIEARGVHVRVVDSDKPSPFATALLFTWVGNYIYDGDAPLAEKRAQALALDQTQLRELLGEPELRELLDADAITQVTLRLQRLGADSYRAKHHDAVHDLLRELGALGRDEVAQRCEGDADEVASWIEALLRSRRVVEVPIAGAPRLVAVEDVGLYRDALGVVPPPGLPQVFLEPVPDALSRLLRRYARTHGPFTVDEVAAALGVGMSAAQLGLDALVHEGGDRALLQGEFLPGRRGLEYCDPTVLRRIRRASLAKLRAAVEPVEPEALGRFLPAWQGVGRDRQGQDALLGVIEQLEGCALPISDLESRVLPARLRPGSFDARDLDALIASGEVLWRGVAGIGPKDGRVALYLADHYDQLAPVRPPSESELGATVREVLLDRGAVFFSELVGATGAFAPDVFEALYDLVWAGEVTNDTLAPLRSLRAGSKDSRSGRAVRAARARRRGRARGRRAAPPGAEGRWSLLGEAEVAPTPTERAEALASQLLERYGVVTREMVRAEGHGGGFSAVYPVLRAMEEAGRVRRGYFLSGMGGLQFARPGAEDRLRSMRDVDPSAPPEVLVLAATDPAQPYGVALPWPEGEGRPSRSAGASVVLVDGVLRGYLSRGARPRLTTYLPTEEPGRSRDARALLGALVDDDPRRGRLELEQIDGKAPADSVLGPHLRDAGFLRGARGVYAGA